MHQTTTRRLLALLGATVAAGLFDGCIKPDNAVAPLAGKELFAACSSCHGPNGEGNASIAAPSIAGLPAWYVESQLVKFRTGVRGAHPDDLEGLRMRPMSRQMKDEGEVKRVSEYVASLPPTKQAKTLTDGDAAAGAAAYATCLACHGPAGLGNEALKAPPIAGQPDWYLLAQLKKFKDGVRGANPKDVTGGQMRPMAMTLADEKAMKNVVAHISTFSR
ncbi:MAG: c-type cytochrome [Myxococcota bacterium]